MWEGSVLCWPLDWMFARSHSHEQRLPELCIHPFVPTYRPSKGGMGGGGHRQAHIKLQRTVNASRVFNQGSDKGLNCLPSFEFVTQFSVNALL